MASLAGDLLVLLAVVALVTAALAARYRLPFRIALRNVRRGKWRTVLIVLGLLVGTTIISGSLVINDTVAAINVHFTYQAWGYTDEAVYNSSVAQNSAPYRFFPIGIYDNLSSAARTNPLIANTTPMLILSGSVLDQSSGIPETAVTFVGANANQSANLGDFTYDNGSTVAGPAAGEVLLDDELASNLGASAGDHVVLHGVAAAPLIVQGVVKDDTRGGFLGGNTAFVTLATAQAVGNVSGRINFIAVTNVGSLTGGVAHSNAVASFLNTTLLGMGSPYGLAAYPVLQSGLASAEQAGANTGTTFLVFGLFSIVAGALLITGIFVNLAEERKGEMGMLRAVGLRRRSLVLVYYFEGIVYSAASALAGTFLGVVVGYILLSVFIRTAQLSAQVVAAFYSSFTVTPQSLVIAYVAGFLLTIVTIAASSGRVSRLNIVRAIRSTPEPPPSLRAYTYLAYLGALLTVLGLLIFFPTRTGSGDITPPLAGLGLVIVGVGLIATRFVRNRFAFTGIGLALVLWGGEVDLHHAVLGTSHSGSIFAIFVEGIEIVLGAVLLFVFNSDLVTGAIARLAGRSPRRISIVRVGLSYPRRRPFRSAVNFAIFAMVVFTVVLVAAYGSSVNGELNAQVTAQSGGYSFFGYTTQPVADLPGAVANNSTLHGEFSNVVPLAVGSVALVAPGWSGPYTDNLFSAPVNAPSSENFYSTNQYNFSATWNGLSTSAVWTELATNSSVVVLDHNYQPGQLSLGGAAHPTVALGSSVRLVNPQTLQSADLRVIAFTSQIFLPGAWTSPAAAAQIGYATANYSGFLFRVAPGVSTTTASQDLKRAFWGDGLVLFDFAQLIQKAIQNAESEIGLLEVFVALGLAVGIAGMGIVALRAVTERRTQIGMLRAEGFTRRMILGSFLVEYTYVALLGILIGTGLATLLYYNATVSGGLGTLGIFVFPTITVLEITMVAYGLTILAILGPSWKAASLPPAEAVRYSE
ncbi:MAG TPA: FtsX-like permease family protein [Thermoplasmata archaeon]|nr:FtsX-like permease family protein [Thermoplasmata archaeon]